MNLLKNKFPKNLSLSELGLWLLIPFASLVSHTWLPFPPTMLLLFGAIVCWIIQQMNGERRTENGELNTTANHLAKPHSQFSTLNSQFFIVFAIFVLYIFVSQYLINASFRHYMGAMFAPLYLIFILLFSERTSPDFLKNLGQKFIHYSLVILCIEAVLRYSFNIYLISQETNYYLGIYQFKFHGPMYLTSNAVACHLISLLFFVFWWARTFKQSMKKELIIIFVLIALTLSRASIPTVAIGLFYYLFFRNLNWKKSLSVLFAFGIIAFFGLWSLKYFINDFSFQSKFLILYESLEYYKTASLKNILFGIGFYETGNIMTHYAHNYFLLFLMETGVFGLLFLCATLFVLIKATNGAAMIVLLPFIIQTSTESNTFLPYFYVIIALMILTKKEEKI